MNTYPNFNFHIDYRASTNRARLGTITTPHGTIKTPAFIFCATKAAMKGLSPHDMKSTDTQIILANTYHLMLNPGHTLVAKAGGLHKLMGWHGPMLTDSGGFQIFSLGHGSVAEEIKRKQSTQRPPSLVNITEVGAKFRSYLDGKEHLLTPEHSIQIQRKLGADLIVVLDECTPFHVEKKYTEQSMHLSHRWAQRSLKEFLRRHDGKQALYGIVQGGVHEDLRKISTHFVNQQDFFAYAIGGSLGASKQQMYEVVDMTMQMLKPDRPVHLLGIGGINDIFAGIKYGVDTFDCVHPTRLARHGGALLKKRLQPDNDKNREHINLKNSCFREDWNPIDSECECLTCKTYSRAYLHYLLRANEMLGLQAISLHNVALMNRLLRDIRQGIAEDSLERVENDWL